MAPKIPHPTSQTPNPSPVSNALDEDKSAAVLRLSGNFFATIDYNFHHSNPITVTFNMNLAIRVFRFFTNMILAGMAISLGAYVYLTYSGLCGALLFSTGLLAVVHHKFFLYTGKIHTVAKWCDLFLLAMILLFNIVGCWMMSLFINDQNVIQECQRIVAERASLSFPTALLKGAGCGFLITLAVISYKRAKLPLILCVVAFIVAGFTHSIADAFYYCVGHEAVSGSAMVAYLGTVIGNFIGGWAYHLGANTPSK